MDQGRHDRRHRVHDALDHGKDGDTLNLDIDPKTHPAWTGGSAAAARPRRPPVALQRASAIWASAARSNQLDPVLADQTKARPMAGAFFSHLWITISLRSRAQAFDLFGTGLVDGAGNYASARA